MKDERGTTFIEIAVALAILGVVAVAFLSGLATASTVTLGFGYLNIIEYSHNLS